MNANPNLQCVVIVTESVIETRLLRDLERCGARGWTITAARGEGPAHKRLSDVEGGHIRIETLVSDDCAERIWLVLEADYFRDYAITAWSYDVHVQRFGRYA